MNINKLKLSPGVASVILLAAFLGGGTFLFTVAIFFLCFCEVDEKIHNTMVKIFTFFVGLTIVSLGWSVIMSGCNLILDAITKLFVCINNFLDPADIIDYAKFKDRRAIKIIIIDSILILIQLVLLIVMFKAIVNWIKIPLNFI